MAEEMGAPPELVAAVQRALEEDRPRTEILVFYPTVKADGRPVMVMAAGIGDDGYPSVLCEANLDALGALIDRLRSPQD